MGLFTRIFRRSKTMTPEQEFDANVQRVQAAMAKQALALYNVISKKDDCDKQIASLKKELAGCTDPDYRKRLESVLESAEKTKKHVSDTADKCAQNFDALADTLNELYARKDSVERINALADIQRAVNQVMSNTDDVVDGASRELGDLIAADSEFTLKSMKDDAVYNMDKAAAEAEMVSPTDELADLKQKYQ